MGILCSVGLIHRDGPIPWFDRENRADCLDHSTLLKMHFMATFLVDYTNQFGRLNPPECLDAPIFGRTFSN
jgi:hypothetical protein